ncbi:ABC transporter substrate-binding protein, partial [uncultured Senegalimassilia sp.]|uniref:substrate-binding periplasmic protein n=1 Tax=uncultured Senegalimassilia sp. TaxID=1714350 RepID=UPI0025FF5DE4
MEHSYTLRAVGRRAAALALSAVLAVTCISLAPLCPASAQEESPDTASQSDAPEIKTVRVGWLLSNQGFQNGMPGEYMSGWGYEYLQTLSYYTPGWKYEYVPGTFPELIQKLKDGEIDLMPNISYTPERAEKLLYSSNPQGMEHYYIYAKPTNDALGAGDPAALNGLTIGLNPDVVQTEVGKQWIENQGISCDYRYYSSGNALFDALSSGEVDAIIMNDTISSADAMPVFSVGESNYFFAVPKSRQDLMDDINTSMAMLRSTNPRYNDEVKTRYSARNSGSSALNGPESAWLVDHGNAITIGYLDNLLPFSNTGQDGQIEGSLSALVNTLEKQYGITVNAVPFESNEDLTNALRDSSIDVAMPINMDYWLAEQAGFIQSSAVTTTSLVAIYTG